MSRDKGGSKVKIDFKGDLGVLIDRLKWSLLLVGVVTEIGLVVGVGDWKMPPLNFGGSRTEGTGI